MTDEAKTTTFSCLMDWCDTEIMTCGIVCDGIHYVTPPSGWSLVRAGKIRSDVVYGMCEKCLSDLKAKAVYAIDEIDEIVGSIATDHAKIDAAHEVNMARIYAAKETP